MTNRAYVVVCSCKPPLGDSDGYVRYVMYVVYVVYVIYVVYVRSVCCAVRCCAVLRPTVNESHNVPGTKFMASTL